MGAQLQHFGPYCCGVPLITSTVTLFELQERHLIKRAALRASKDRANNYLCSDGGFLASPILHHKTISLCPIKQKLEGKHLREKDPFCTLSPGGLPGQCSRSVLDKTASNAVVTGGLREDEQSKREPMADCAAPTIDLFTLWGRWKEQLYIYSERKVYSFFATLYVWSSKYLLSNQKSVTVESIDWKSSPLESQTILLWHWVGHFNSAPEIEMPGCSGLPSRVPSDI